MTDLVFLQLQVPQLVDCQGFKCGMEERKCMQPLQRRAQCSPVDQQPSEEEIEQHHKGADQTRYADRLEGDREHEDNAGSGEVEQNEGEHELPEARHGGHQADQPIYDTAEHEWRDKTQGENVEEDLGGEVGEGGVVSVGPVEALAMHSRSRAPQTDLSRMKRILSFANRPRLERQEKPNSARVKKKIPEGCN